MVEESVKEWCESDVPYPDVVSESAAKDEWCRLHADQIPPWVADEEPLPSPARCDDCRSAAPSPPPAPPPPQPALPTAPPATEAPAAVLAPSPLPLGTRVHFLASRVDSYGRGVVEENATIEAWDGRALTLRVGRSEARVRVDPARVSALDDFGRPLTPGAVCWRRGDPLPPLPLPPPGSAATLQPRPTTEQPRPEPHRPKPPPGQLAEFAPQLADDGPDVPRAGPYQGLY